MKTRSRRFTACILALILTVLYLSAADRSGSRSRLRASAAVEIPGIDISKYQEEIDWDEVAKSGVKFAILRCCKVIRAYDDWELDSTFETNYEGAKAAGVAVGCYLFTDAATEDEFLEDVGYMLGFLKDKSFEFPVFLDLESPIRQEHLPSEVFMPALLAGLEKIEDAGHTAGVYSSSAFYSECIDRQTLLDAKYPIWEANYFNTTNGLVSPVGYDLSGEATIWQYSGCGRCPGIRTTVDRNICYTYQFFNHQAVIANSVLPGGTLKAGSNFTLAGTVSSDNVLRTITGTITRKGANEAIQSVTVYPHAKEYKLTGFFTKKLIFSTLTEGEYDLCIKAVDSAGVEIEVVKAPFSVGPDEIPPQTDPNSAEIVSSHSLPEFHFAEQGHRREASAAIRKPAGSLPLRITAWLYRRWGLPGAMRTATKIGCKCGLERTPLFRIVSKTFFRLESGGLALNLMQYCAAAPQEAEAAPEPTE